MAKEKIFKNVISKITILALVAVFTIVCPGCGKDKEEQTDKETVEPVSDRMEDVKEMGMQSDYEESNAAMDVKEPSLSDKTASMTITYRFGDQTETLDGATITGWLVTLPNGSVSVNEERAKEYVADLASKHDTFGRNRSFTTHDGRTITVTGGDYGYWMDKVSTREELIAQILTGESAELEPVYYGRADNYGDNDIGNTYVEINIGEQHLWIFKDGKQINESDFVSGCLFKGNGTPEGTYAITYKERDSTLVGEGYQSSVKYWMPFNGNIGLHDASWRDEFGGHIYYMNGSHGCVNLPSEKAAEIYGQVDKGEAVVVYGSISKEEALSTLTMDDKVKAAEKGYIPLSVEIATYMYQQQGFDDASAAALAAAQVNGEVSVQQTDNGQNEGEASDQQTDTGQNEGEASDQQTDTGQNENGQEQAPENTENEDQEQ